MMSWRKKTGNISRGEQKLNYVALRQAKAGVK